jgi:hypothetical protein
MSRQRFAAYFLTMLSAVLPLWSQQSNEQRGKVCWPLHFSGIVPGITDDSQVQRLLGAGVFRKDEGDTGGRYFIDKAHTATLHVVSFTMNVVGEVMVKRGVDPKLNATELKQAESQWFQPGDGFGNWHALQLGSSEQDVLRNLGEPKKRIAANDWRYETVCECEIPEYFDLFFKDGHVIKVVFSAPAG